MRHIYKIIYNGYEEDGSNICFNYDYSSVKDIRLSFSEGKACIEFSMLTKKTLDDFLSFNVRPFKDAYSKIYMLHILLFGRGITIESIEFILDNDHYNLDSTYDKFPLMYSMLKNEHIKISDSWKSIAESYSKATKSSISNDYRYTALYAFLLSQSREFEFDRFQNLWTAMNATYSYVAKCYEESLKMRFGAENEQVLKKLAMVGNDQKSLGALAYIVGGDYKRISAKDSQELLREYYGIERVLGEINEKDFPEFYDECEKNIDKKSVSNSNYYNQLEKIAVKFEVPVYVLLILGYPYSWRCKYLHGNYISPIFMAYNDDEYCGLKILNYFLSRFLEKEIPLMFSGNYWNDNKMESIIKMIEKCYPDDYKKYINLQD